MRCLPAQVPSLEWDKKNSEVWETESNRRNATAIAQAVCFESRRRRVAASYSYTQLKNALYNDWHSLCQGLLLASSVVLTPTTLLLAGGGWQQRQRQQGHTKPYWAGPPLS